MNIRAATNSDTPSIKELVFGVLREYGLEPDPSSTDKDLDDLEKNYFLPGGYFAVLEDNNLAIIGCAGIFTITSTTCELRKMYLAPSTRGQGYGKQLLKFSLYKAKELGFTRVELETASALKEAIELYKKFGFKPYNSNHIVARCDQAYFLAI